MHTITDAADGSVSIFVADVDGDGSLDVLSASFFDDTVAWFKNRRAILFADGLETGVTSCWSSCRN